MDKKQRETKNDIGDRTIPKFHPHDFSKDIIVEEVTSSPVATGRSRLNKHTEK